MTKYILVITKMKKYNNLVIDNAMFETDTVTRCTAASSVANACHDSVHPGHLEAAGFNLNLVVDRSSQPVLLVLFHLTFVE
jgi:predicted dithiol-disulfide oxidoreductase (DUF899 family)